MNVREFRDVLTHMEWADAHTWRSVRDLPQALTDERWKYLFHHVHLVQSVYLQAWRGDPFVVTALSAYSDLAAIEAWARPWYRQANSFAETLEQTTLDRPMHFPWTDLIEKQFGTVRPATMGESAWQVFSHTTYHRGQIATRVREVGGEPPTVDYLAWVWAGRPAPAWTTTSS